HSALSNELGLTASSRAFNTSRSARRKQGPRRIGVRGVRSMKSHDLCLRLLGAESEAEVQQIIDTTPEMANPKNWRPLDRGETNFNITSNQASDGGKALTELMTNMVDAVLLKHARLKGIDPKGKIAPASMYDAVDKLITPLHGGKLVNLDATDPWLREFAQK